MKKSIGRKFATPRVSLTAPTSMVESFVSFFETMFLRKDNDEFAKSRLSKVLDQSYFEAKFATPDYTLKAPHHGLRASSAGFLNFRFFEKIL